MRLLLLAPFAAGGPKGTTRWRVLPLARALAACGHTVCVLVPPYDCPAQSGLVWIDEGVEVRNIVVPPMRGGLGHVEMARRLGHAAVAWQPDLVHCFKPKGPAGLAAWMLRQVPGWQVPLVMDTDDWEAGWNPKAGYPLVWRTFFNWQEQWGLRCSDMVTAASRWLMRFAREARLHGPKRAYLDTDVVYLPNGVDPVAIAAEPRNPGNGSRLLAYTRFVEHPVEFLGSIWSRITRAEPHAQLIVAGPMLGAAGSRVGKAAFSPEISRSVFTVGWVPSASRAGLFAAVDAAIMPVMDTPLNRAKSPVRLLDLLAAGLPVATQDVGEYGVLVHDGVTGLTTKPGDLDALAAAAIRLLRDPSLRVRLGQAAREGVRTEHAWTVLADRALLAYASVSAPKDALPR